MAFDVTKIEERIDRTAAGAVAISDTIGGVQFTSMMEVMEFAKLMAVSGIAVPPHLRGSPGACLAVSIQALEWRMSPFAVANKSYAVNNRGTERIAYESQLIHAVIEARAPLAGRLRYEIIGEGDERRCRVWGVFRGEAEPHVYTSETLAKLRDARGRNDRGDVKGSPLWDAQPDVQLFYSASRQWCRLYAPDVLLGIYARDELDDGPDGAKDVTPPKATPAIADRLKRKAGGRGFDAGHVEREASAATGGTQTIEGTAAPAGGDGGPPGAEAHGAAGPAPQRDGAGRTDDAPGGIDGPGDGDPIANTAADTLDAAKARGAEAASAGKSRRAIPAEYKGHPDLMEAWIDGHKSVELPAPEGAAATDADGGVQ